MLTVRQRRPFVEGFLSLIPDCNTRSLKSLVLEVEKHARAARDAAEHSRASALDAVWEEEQGLPDRARRHLHGAAVDHRLACAELAALAATFRTLLRWAALDWRPSLDVAGSGLTTSELACLVCVMGAELDAEVASDVDHCG